MILRDPRTILIMLSILMFLGPARAVAQATTLPPLVTVEWYPPEIEDTDNPERALVILSGRTLPNARIQVDGENFTMVRAIPTAAPSENTSGEETAAAPQTFTWQPVKNCKAYTLPHLNSKIAGEIKVGSRYKATDHSEDWIKVSGGKREAYAPKSCFSLSKSPSGPSASANNKASSEKMASPQTTANLDGFFEVAVDSPRGLMQVPVLITAREGLQKTFLVTFDVAANNVKMNNEVSKSKPPAAAKSLRLWLGLGTTIQKYSQTVTTSSVSFQNTDSPSLLARLGYWKNSWGFDLFYRDAPGKIDQATAPFQISSTKYHWKTTEARGHYQFERGEKSRLLGLPSQWQLLFGLQMHKMPFLSVDNLGNVSVLQNGINTAILGVGLLLGQERDWSYEFALEYQQPISASSSGGKFSVSSAVAYDARLGLNYKLNSDWRLGFFAYLQSHSYKFNFENSATATQVNGNQNLFYSTFDLHLGYEY